MTYIKPLIAVLLSLLVDAAMPFEDHRWAFGTVTRVIDGDTLWIKLEGRSAKPVKVRLRGIDAPEICQVHGAEAKLALEQKVLHRPVRYRSVARDSYHRSVADVSLHDEDIGAWMVRTGQAWNYRFRDGPGQYPDEEAVARREQRGLFADVAAVAPGAFRKAHGSCAAFNTRGRTPS